jgi:hypothetical protein
MGDVDKRSIVAESFRGRMRSGVNDITPFLRYPKRKQIMSNRNKWAHWNKPKREKHPLLMKWSVGTACVVLGSLLVLAGWQGLHDNILWYQDFSFRSGGSVMRETVSLILFGAVFLLCGITILLGRK